MLNPRKRFDGRGPLIIWVFSVAVVLTFANAAHAARTHVVQPGETLYRIAKRYGVTMDLLARANGLADLTKIKPGQRLLIPDHDSAAGPSLVQGPPLPRTTHVVQRGETLYRIALRYATTVPTLMEANGLTSDRILVGQVLRIPASTLFPSGARFASPAEPPIVPSAGSTSPAVRRAMDWLGTPYRWGGTSREGLDCSGLVYLVFAPWVPNMPRTSFEQFRLGQPVGRWELIPGDLVFFSTYAPGASHVGIYLGDGRFIHSARSTRGVAITSLSDPYFSARYLGARRIHNP